MGSIPTRPMPAFAGMGHTTPVWVLYRALFLENMDTRIVFLGSPEFALPSLQALVERFTVVGVVTQPDRPARRGLTLTPPPVKLFAFDHSLPFIQPERLNDTAVITQLNNWNPEVMVVAAFGQILRSSVLNLPSLGCINVHASLLPRWRGAAPVAASILNGDEYTGVSIMLMNAGVDTGPVLSQRSTPIHNQETEGGLADRLARLGAELLTETLPGYLSGQIAPQPQNDSLATYAPMIKKEDAHLKFTEPADLLTRKILAYNPWPGAFTYWRDQRLIILSAHVIETGEQPPTKAGTTTCMDNFPAIITGKGVLVLDIVQLSGKKAMSGQDFLRGARGWQDGVLLS